MSWFQGRPSYNRHMQYRESHPDRYIEKFGTNKHVDHSKVLSDNLSVNQRLVDTVIYQLVELLPQKKVWLPQAIEVHFGSSWEEHHDNDYSIIGCVLPYTIDQNGKKLREGRLKVSNWGNRGEPASVYADAFSRFLIFDIKKQNSTTRFDMLTQFGFHKFLNSKYMKLLNDYKILGVSKDVKQQIIKTLENGFELKTTKDSVILPTIEIRDDESTNLHSLIEHLLIIGLVKESFRGRFPELHFDWSFHSPPIYSIPFGGELKKTNKSGCCHH